MSYRKIPKNIINKDEMIHNTKKWRESIKPVSNQSVSVPNQLVNNQSISNQPIPAQAVPTKKIYKKPANKLISLRKIVLKDYNIDFLQLCNDLLPTYIENFADIEPTSALHVLVETLKKYKIDPTLVVSTRIQLICEQIVFNNLLTEFLPENVLNSNLDYMSSTLYELNKKTVMLNPSQTENSNEVHDITQGLNTEFPSSEKKVKLIKKEKFLDYFMTH